ncbi:MAG TPA: DUF58 domain-containing protein [Acidobacteriaceae bacterium]|jgi:uncharacterized protein (DUF58 family)
MNQFTVQPDRARAPAQPRGHLAWALTPRALYLLLAGCLFLAPGFFHARYAFGMLAWDLCVLVATIVDGARLPAPGLIDAQRAWLGAPSLGREVEVELALTQHGGSIIHCTLLDDLPSAFLDEPATYRLDAYPEARATIRYRFTPAQRGDHAAGKLYLRYRSKVGLAERWAIADLTQTVRIYPTLRTPEENRLYLARHHRIELQMRLRRQRGMGRDFESLRDYLEGDELRDICWTASARRGSLVTRLYEMEKSQPVWLVLDAGRLQGARVGRYTKLDQSAAAALALAQIALTSGDRVGLLAYGRETQQLVLPGRGAAHLRLLLDALAQVRPEPLEADHLRATATLMHRQSRRSLILWMTDFAETAMQPEVLDAAAQLVRRHLLLFIAISQRDVQRLASATPETIDAMFETAAAQELLDRRERLLRRLEERGAMTLETQPESLAGSVLNRYLEVKEQGLL